MRKFTVAIDLDGVIWDLVTPWIMKYNEITGENIRLEDIKSYDISDYIDHDGILRYILEMNGFWSSVNLYDGTKEAIDILKAHPKIDLVIVTATSYEIAKSKMNRLFQLIPSIEDTDIIMTNRKDLLDVAFMIDDYENNLKSMATRGHGIPILIDQPYNQLFPNKTYGIIRKNNLLEAAQTILEYIKIRDEAVKLQS